MSHLFNEIGISLVIGSGNWIGVSHEVEYDDGNESRSWGWQKSSGYVHEGNYLRIWIYKTVFVYSSKGWDIKKKEKVGLKCVFGRQYRSLDSSPLIHNS